MTQTQEIITHKVLKIHEWIQGDVSVKLQIGIRKMWIVKALIDRL